MASVGSTSLWSGGIGAEYAGGELALGAAGFGMVLTGATSVSSTTAGALLG